jgi:hypothetical protein
MKQTLSLVFSLLFVPLSFARAQGEGDFTDYRREFRRQLIEKFERAHRQKSPPRRNDDPSYLVDRLELLTLSQMHATYRSWKLKNAPWSDTYWPIYQGQIAQRYGDNSFPHSIDWKKNVDYVRGVISPNASSVEMLSPAEKYDLLVGDQGFTMTHANLNEGKGYYDREGKVETWMGLCHGWAPAAYMELRPRFAITLLAADGRTRIPFWPSDVKALSTLLWANGTAQTKFISSRCNEKNPERDDLGRPRNPDCIDTNPATWHLSVVNQIAVSQRSFVIDATYDYQVWNQPVLSYSYRYFNPQTAAETDDLDAATVSVSEFSTDRYRAYRSPRAQKIVGIQMELTYVSENHPSTRREDSEAHDQKDTVSYRYDLELDAQGQLVGGEWHDRNHPDFLWTPEKDALIDTVGDQILDDRRDTSAWDGRGSIPESWKPAIQQGSRYAQPLRRLVHTLVVLSQIEP